MEVIGVQGTGIQAPKIDPFRPGKMVSKFGERGEITYRPNWGQPIVGGQWRGQPQPAQPAIDPSEIIKTNLDQLWTDFKQRASTLKASGLDPQVHNRILAGWQDEYDQAKAELTGTQSQLGLIEQSIRAGEMAPKAGREAAIRMIVPRETADLMFPSVRPEPRPGVTGTPVGTQAAQIKFFTELAKDAIIKPWWERNYADPAILTDMFLTQWGVANLDDPRNINERLGFIQSWKTAMEQDPHTNKIWKTLSDKKTGDPKIIMRITVQSRLGDAARRNAGISPWGRSIAKELPRSTQPVSDPLGIR